MSMIFRAIAFTFVPTVVELALVSVIMARTFSPLVSALVVLTFAAYVLFSIGMTQVRLGGRVHPHVAYGAGHDGFIMRTMQRPWNPMEPHGTPHTAHTLH